MAYFLKSSSRAERVVLFDEAFFEGADRDLKYSHRLARSLSRTHSADDSRHSW